MVFAFGIWDQGPQDRPSGCDIGGSCEVPEDYMPLRRFCIVVISAVWLAMMEAASFRAAGF